MTSDRRGFTLVELIVVAVLGTLVMGTVLQVLITNQRTYTAQAATVSGQQSVRMALDVLFAELREVSPAGGDIIAMGKDSIRVRLMRKFGYVCDTDFSAEPILRVIPQGIGVNQFASGDSVFVFADNRPKLATDDRWFPAQVTGASPVTCPQAGETAQDLLFGGQSSIFSADSVGIGAPVRSFREFTFGATLFLGDVYLGRREGSGDMIPVAGPIRARNGIEFVYRDAMGTLTSTATDVRQIEVIIRTGSEVLDPLGGTVQDSISAWIYTRN